jgi:hypothetical protein
MLVIIEGEEVELESKEELKVLIQEIKRFQELDEQKEVYEDANLISEWDKLPEADEWHALNVKLINLSMLVSWEVADEVHVVSETIVI